MIASAIITAAYRELGFIEPASLDIVTPATQDAQQAVAILYAEARHLRGQKFFPQMKKIHSFATTASRSKYPLPADYHGMVGQTGWDRTNSFPLGSPITDPELNEEAYGYVVSGTPYGYRIFGPDNNAISTGGQFVVFPTPTAVATISFEYFSKNLFAPPHWLASTAGYTVNTYCSSLGNIYKVTAITTGTTGTTPPSHTSGAVVDGGVTWTYQNIAYEECLGANDVCLFDDDLMIAGMKWRIRQAKDLDMTNYLAEHNALLDKAKTRWYGSFKGRLDGADTNRRRRYGPPYRSWSF